MQINMLIILIPAILVSCKGPSPSQEKEGEKEGVVSINQVSNMHDSLIHKIRIKGDTNAYDELFYGFIDSNKTERTDSILRYARVMAEAFKYERAYFDYLKALCEKNMIESHWDNLSDLNLTNLDENSKAPIISWLRQMLKDEVITQDEFDSVEK